MVVKQYGAMRADFDRFAWFQMWRVAQLPVAELSAPFDDHAKAVQFDDLDDHDRCSRPDSSRHNAAASMTG